MNPVPDIEKANANAPDAEDANGASPVALVESYRRLADVFHDVLSEQSLDALLERVAEAVGELIPHDDLAFYEADESAGELRAVFARGQYAEEVLADEPFAFGQRHHRLGRRAPPAGAGEPRRSRSARALRRGHTAGSRSP